MARNLSDWLQGYIEYTANLEAPEKFHFWTGVATIAGALQGKCWVDMGKWKWKPNFYIIFVAPPGIIGKSTTADVGIGLLRDIDGIHFGPMSATWQALLDSFLESGESFPMPDGSFVESASITFAISELGVFLDPQNREQMDLLVHMWDGWEVPLERRTKGDGKLTIKNPWLNMIACTTPAWISEHFPEYAIGGGFTSRTVFLFGDHKRKLIAYPSRVKGAQYAPAFRQLLIDDLKSIARLNGEFKLTEKAYQWGEVWYENHWMDLPEHLKDERMSGYVARKQTQMHKLAMVLSAARREDMIITENELKTAEAFIGGLEQDSPRIFNRISDSKEARYADVVFSFIKRLGKVKKRELWRKVFHAMSLTDFENSLNAVIGTGYVRAYANGVDVTLVYSPQDTPQPDHETLPSTSSQPESASPDSSLPSAEPQETS